MTNFDPTTNRIPFGLLTPEEQAAMTCWPHGWQMFGGGGWSDRPEPMWVSHRVYRGKPAPAKVAYQDEAALHELKRIYTPADVQHLLDNRPTWENWKEILAAGYAQKARADRLEAALREIGNRPTWEGWRGILAAGCRQQARADRLEAALRETTQILRQCTFQCILVGGRYLDREEVVSRSDAALKGDE